jgi:hypothetical protein
VEGETDLVRPASGPAIVTSAPVSGYAMNGDISGASPWTEHRAKDRRLAPAELKAEVAAAEAQGAHVIAADQDLWPDQLAVVVAEAHARGLAVTAQPALTTYPAAVRAGVDVFTRNDRYSLAVTKPEDFEAYANDPRGPGARPAVRAVCQSAALADGIAAFGGQLASSQTVLMPVLSMEATADDVGGPNPWTLRSAMFVRPGDLDDPVDPETGARPYLVKQPAARERIQGCARSKQAIDRGLHAAGAHYVAGTATPSYGVIPGGGLHGELRLLQAEGLSPREALGAATSVLAAALHLPDRGRVAVGKRADLVLLTADPRTDVGAVDAIAAVIFDGHLVDRAALAASAKGRRPT